jgi:cardiolipin synthase A/B
VESQRFKEMKLRAAAICIAFVITLLSSACSSLPRFVPNMALSNRPVIQLEGANGQLSKEKSRAILAALKARSGTKETNIFDRHLALEEAIVGSPLTVGNLATLLRDGPATYAAMLKSIAAATDHINMETYIFEDDAVGREFMQALIDKQHQGVQVNIIRDSVGTYNTPAAFFEKLRNAGINVLEFNPVNPLMSRNLWELNRRDHRKLLIVDGSTAFLGGINISSVYSGGSSRKTSSTSQLSWRDTHLQLEGPVVAELQKLFILTWEKQKGDALLPNNFFPPSLRKGSQIVRAIGSAPEDPYSQIYATLLSAISSAESSIQLTNAYFAPDPQLLSGLKDAVTRGVKVTLILPSQTDSWLAFHAGRAYYSQLLKAGVRIFQRRNAVLHAKTAVIDGVWATIGSTNLDWRSFLHNQELNAVMLGQEFSGQLQTMFESDLLESDEITLEQWQQRALNERVKEVFARMWEYWL